MSGRMGRTVPAIYLCGGNLTTGPRDDCPNPLHDYPLPSGYVDHAEAATRRLYRRWSQKKCPDCGLYGWRPGEPTGDPCDERVPAPGVAGLEMAATKEAE